jgi:hypothetical protein
VWLAQAALALAVIVFVWRSVAGRWEEFRSLEFPLELHVGWIALAGALVLLTYGLLVAAWRAVIVGWRERLAFGSAARIWTVSNLGRYLPGKVWSIAGLAVLAQREGVAGWAAVGAAVAMQALAVGTGTAVAAATVPGTLSTPGILVAAAVAAGTVGARATPRIVAVAARATRRPDLRALPVGVVALAGTVTTLSWVSYGVAFWCLARGTLGPTSLGVAPAVGVFAGGYITGLLALFAPGGVGVREAVFIALLAPSVGSGGAVVLGLASRVLLTITEVLAALLGLLLRRGRAVAPSGPEAPPGD